MLRGYIIEFSAKRKKMVLHRQDLLRVHLEQLQDALNSCNSNDLNSLLADIKSCQYELDSMIEEKAKKGLQFVAVQNGLNLGKKIQNTFSV